MSSWKNGIVHVMGFVAGALLVLSRAPVVAAVDAGAASNASPGLRGGAAAPAGDMPFAYVTTEQVQAAEIERLHRELDASRSREVALADRLAAALDPPPPEQEQERAKKKAREKEQERALPATSHPPPPHPPQRHRGPGGGRGDRHGAGRQPGVSPADADSVRRARSHADSERRRCARELGELPLDDHWLSDAEHHPYGRLARIPEFRLGDDAEPARRALPAIDERVFSMEGLLRHRPLVIRGAALSWPAIRRWTDAYLEDHLGEEPVFVDVSADNVFRLAQRADAPAGAGAGVEAPRVEEMRFGEFLHEYAAPNRTRSLYVTSRSSTPGTPGAGAAAIDRFRRAAGRMVRDDVPELPLLRLMGSDGVTAFNLWLGSGGQVTPAHMDRPSNFICLLAGEKRVSLFPPSDTEGLYPWPTVARALTSQVDVHDPDTERFPLFPFAKRFEVRLLPGDVLFVPSMWWHSVVSLGRNLMINFYSSLKGDGLLYWLYIGFHFRVMSANSPVCNWQRQCRIVEVVVACCGRDNRTDGSDAIAGRTAAPASTSTCSESSAAGRRAQCEGAGGETPSRDADTDADADGRSCVPCRDPRLESRAVERVVCD